MREKERERRQGSGQSHRPQDPTLCFCMERKATWAASVCVSSMFYAFCLFVMIRDSAEGRTLGSGVQRRGGVESWSISVAENTKPPIETSGRLRCYYPPQPRPPQHCRLYSHATMLEFTLTNTHMTHLDLYHCKNTLR